MDENNNAVENNVVEDDENQDLTTLFLGDSGCGKSTLIQSFLKPNVTKEPKPTFALEYNYARKKVQSGSNQRAVAHIWEIGGDIYEPKLLEIPITAKTISSATIVLCCDLAKPQNCLSSLLRWIDIIKRRIAEIKATNATAITNLREIHKNHYKEHPDAAIVSSSVGIPLYIVLNKYDIFKTLPLSDKRNLLETIRFFAHYYGASIITSSSVDLSLKESFKINCQILAFRLSSKLPFDTSSDKPIFISVGKDNFSEILTSGENAKQYLSSSGCTRECWKLLIEKMKNIFGNHDPSPNETGPEEDENEFPEPEGNYIFYISIIYYIKYFMYELYIYIILVDSMRLQRDVILAKYIQEQERQEAILLKVNSLSNDDASQSKIPIESKENSNIAKPKVKKTTNTKDKESKSSSSDERKERK